MKLLQCVIVGVLGLGVGVAMSCKSSDDGQDASAEFCPALEGYVSQCDTPNACEEGIVRDCDSLQAVVTTEFAKATAVCMNALGNPQSCLDEATELSTSSSRVEAFATAMCLECGDGAGACESNVLSADSDDPFGRAGRLAKILSVQALEEVQDECTTGDDCAANFETCAKRVLSRDVPDVTASCLVDSVFDNYDRTCGDEDDSNTDTDSSDTDPSGSDTFPTDPTDATDPTDTDPTNTSDTEGDTDDSCDAVGCDCMFNEDCAGDLVCPEGTCEEPVECADDPFEPNNGEIQATLLPPITDDDDMGDQLDSELEAPGDIDWFAYEGDDTSFAIVGPYARVNINALELCIYAECLSGLGDTEVTCNDGTTQQPSPNGRPGCCGMDTGGFDINLSCGGTFSDDNAQIFMSVTGSEPGICQEYTLEYHY